ncbi:MAG: hypothetical protein GC137_02765 [Alphaproteobacteria bacterium]|nr:hypothetical protein [Alphaproteobacteria bacterium]
MEHITAEALLSHEQTQAPVKTKKSYYVHNDRMAGSVRSYDAPAKKERTFEDVLSSYAPQADIPDIEYTIEKENKFGFFDLVDMANPLQHIPLVNLGYRAITGDEIKPVSKVIGGAVFGGAAGAAIGLANVVIEEETGKDMVGTATAFAGVRKDRAHDVFDVVEEPVFYDDLALALLSEPPSPIARIQETQTYERVQVAGGRTAGTIAVYA